MTEVMHSRKNQYNVISATRSEIARMLFHLSSYWIPLPSKSIKLIVEQNLKHLALQYLLLERGFYNK